MPAQARFCPECGTPLDAAVAPAVGPVEERRLLSIVFADLAGFTQRSDHADPEDVRGILVPFHAIAKEEIERFGGMLDKFIGDAALGVFGAPIAHEDDAERAVRAALAIRERVSRDGMPVRVAVNTGEALVTTGEGPQVGEHVAGDVVNTASRLQNLAPVGDVVVGDTTARATRRVIDYEELPSATVKGKAEPLGLWLARSVRPTIPERDEDDPPPFVGRERERQGLRDLLARTIRDRTPHLVTVVGEPGLGKSRLLADLGEHVRAGSDEVSFHRGRCLPYGESITYAALVDIVRALVGVAPDETRERAADALRGYLPSLDTTVDEREWLHARIHALVGPITGSDQDSVDRAESFAAWTRFLELSAQRTPLVMVVEDLHWAEPAMLEFLGHVIEQAGSQPLLMLCTTRPELFTMDPSWGTGIARATTLTLSPLSDHDMRELLGALLLASVVPDDARGSLMRRAGGNPLYAREFVHMLEDRAPAGGEEGRSDADDDRGRHTPSVNVPDTVQALIAARLDVLAPADRSLLQAAAVVGDRFWPGALRALEPTIDPDDPLHELQRRGLIRRSPLSTIGDESEFAFTHGLIRDVAYGRLPRVARSRMHLEVTRWLEASAGDAVRDRADLLASHAVRALDLAKAAGLDEEIPELEATALRFLVMAGEHQTGLDARRAAEYYARAVELAPATGVARAELLRLATGLGWRSGAMTSEEAVAAYRSAIELALTADAPITAAQVMRRLYFQLGLQGKTSEARDVLDEAIELLEAQPEPGQVLAELYACRSEAEMFAGRSQDSLSWASRALELPRSSEITLMALHLRGNARCELGDYGGVDDLREALTLSQDSDMALHIVTSYSYLVERVGLLEGPTPALEMNQAAVELCERRGLVHQSMWSRTERLWLLFDAGRWDEITEVAERLRTWSLEHGEVQVSTVADTFLARVLRYRGDTQRAVELLAHAIPAAQEIADLQVLSPALFVGALVAEALGDHADAAEQLRAYHDITVQGPSEYREIHLPEAVRSALRLRDPALAATLLEGLEVHEPRMSRALDAARAAIAETEGRFDEAADLFGAVAHQWADWAMPFEQAHALAGLARCRRAQDRVDESHAASTEADRLFTELAVPTDAT